MGSKRLKWVPLVIYALRLAIWALRHPRKVRRLGELLWSHKWQQLAREANKILDKLPKPS